MPGAWTIGGNLINAINAHAACGVRSAALSFGGWVDAYSTITEEYDGNVWSLGGSCLVARDEQAGAGTQTAGLCFGGYGGSILPNTEEYDGITWSVGGDLGTATYACAGAGTQTAALCFGGYNGGYLTTTQEYDGATWAIVAGVLGTARGWFFGCGSQGAALGFGGWTGAGTAVTEEYNGLAWSAGGSLSAGRYAHGGCGVQTAALAFGGVSSLASSEEYDGSAWTAGGDLNVGREWLPGCGLLTGGLSIGGWDTDYSVVTEEYAIQFPMCLRYVTSFGASYNVFALLGALGDTLEQLILNPIGSTECLNVLGSLSDLITKLQVLTNQLLSGDPFTTHETLVTSLQANGKLLPLVNDLSDLISRVQVVVNELSDSTTKHENLINSLAVADDIQMVQLLINSLSDSSVVYPDCTISIYLNSKPVTLNKIVGFTLTLDRSISFDTISLQSSDPDFYLEALACVGGSDGVLEVLYKGTSWSFLVEEVPGYERSFTVWGRSVAASSSDAPFVDSSDYVLETATMAASVAAALVPALAVTWSVVDWLVPSGWSVSGTPMEMLKELAANVGAVVRNYPDGTGLQVVYKYPTRPIDLAFATPIESFDRDESLLALSTNLDVGTGENAVTVYGYSPFNEYSILLEADSCVNVGSQAEIKVYPGLGGVGYTLEASMGTPVYKHKKTVSHEEVVAFTGGKGSVQYPIMSLTSISWDGNAPASYDWVAGQTEIVLDDESVIAVGTVKYTTSYDVWNATHTGAGHLVVAYTLEENGGVIAKVYFDDGDKEADSIDRPALGSIEAVTMAGTTYLDDASYSKLGRDIEVPCSGLFDGEVAAIKSQLTAVVGNAIVVSHRIEGKVVNDIMKIISVLHTLQFGV